MPRPKPTVESFAAPVESNSPFDATSLQPFIDAAIAAGGDDPMETLTFEQDPAAPAPSRKFRKIGLPAMAAGSALDIGSTFAALGRPGTREGNPLYGGMSRGKIVGANAAISALLALALDRLAKQHDGLATGVGLTVGGVRGAVGAHNLSMGQK